MAVSQSGSRAGLITALVIFVILFFVAAIFAVIKGSDATRLQNDLTNLQNQYDLVISRAELPTVNNEVDQVRRQPGNTGRTFYDIVRARQEDLTRSLTGQPASAQVAIQNWNNALANARQQLQSQGITLSANSATEVLAALQTQLQTSLAKVTQLETEVKQLNDRLAQEVAKTAAVQARFDQTAGQLNQRVQQANQDRDAYQRTKDEQIASLEKTLADTVAEGRTTAERLSEQLRVANAQVAELQRQNEILVQQIAQMRPSGTMAVRSAMRQPDGQIIRVDRGNVVYVNLGQGQQITPGMTFQIYDKNEGMPRIGQNPDELPPGKGMLEVVRVGAGSSEARVLNLQPGEQVIEGDLIANLIYDPNVKWAFRVYGKFDLDQDGVATDSEAEIVKRLIVQWGGRLTDDITTATDFVVLGQEPVVPTSTDPDDPVAEFQRQQAEAALTAYNAERDRALQLHIPLLNQNRFLYLVGFYNQVQRYAP